MGGVITRLRGFGLSYPPPVNGIQGVWPDCRAPQTQFFAIMREIKLTRGKVALVDDDDFEALSKFKWTATTSQHGWRAYRRSGGRTIYMHQQIMGFPGSEVDHRDRDGLHNWRSNLRLATRSQQAANSDWKRPHGYRGIYPHRKAWCARVTVMGKNHYLGSFQTKIEAANAYDRAALAAFGEFAVLNNKVKTERAEKNERKQSNTSNL